MDVSELAILINEHGNDEHKNLYVSLVHDRRLLDAL